MALAFGSMIGAFVGLGVALLQVKLVRLYAKGKPEHIQERAIATIDQLKLSSFFGLPIIFAIIGYMIAATYMQ